jgi:hypothetical protein
VRLRGAEVEEAGGAGSGQAVVNCWDMACVAGHTVAMGFILSC